MTTATDWDVRDAETGPLRVTDVEAALRLDGAATDTDLHTALADNTALRAELHRTRAELAQLRAIVSPLEAPWTPPTEQPTAWIEERVIAGRAAEHRDSYDTHSYIARLHREDGARWDSVHDDVEALTAHEPVNVWDDALRALTEPVEVSDKWLDNENRMMVGVVAAEYWRTHPAEPSPLDPEVLDAEARARAERQVQVESGADLADGPPHRLPPNDEPPPEHDRQGTDPDPTPEHERQPDDRAPLDKLKRRVPTALTTGEQPGPESQPETPEQTPAPRRSWWRTEWVAGAVIVVGWVAIIATMVVLA